MCQHTDTHRHPVRIGADGATQTERCHRCGKVRTHGFRPRTVTPWAPPPRDTGKGRVRHRYSVEHGEVA